MACAVCRLSCWGSAISHIGGVSPSLMGATVSAWGNSVGDLVADVAMARDGYPSIALAGCFASPLFQMLGGAGAGMGWRGGEGRRGWRWCGVGEGVWGAGSGGCGGVVWLLLGRWGGGG